METTQISLIERLRSRPDDDAWRRLVEIYTPLIQCWMRNHRVAEQDADDISQEVLAAVTRRLSKFEHSGRPGAFRRWLRMIVFHRIVGHWRGRKPDQSAGTEMPDLAQLQDPESVLSRQWDAEHDQHVMQMLLLRVEPEFTSTTWQAFQQLAIHHASPSATAEELGLTVNAVLLAKFRVLKRLREEAAGLID